MLLLLLLLPLLLLLLSPLSVLTCVCCCCRCYEHHGRGGDGRPHGVESQRVLEVARCGALGIYTRHGRDDVLPIEKNWFPFSPEKERRRKKRKKFWASEQERDLDGSFRHGKQINIIEMSCFISVLWSELEYEVQPFNSKKTRRKIFAISCKKYERLVTDI